MQADFIDFIFEDRHFKTKCFEQKNSTTAFYAEAQVAFVDDGQGGQRRVSGSDPLWNIRRIIKKGNEFVEQYASQGYDKKWSDRETFFDPVAFTATLSTDHDGVNDYIDFGDVHNFDHSQAFSVSLWVKPNNVNDFRVLFAKAGAGPNVRGYMLRHQDDGKLFTQLRSVGANRTHIFNSTLTTNVWQHVVFTYNGSSNIDGAKVYLNGVIDTNLPASGTLSGGWLENQPYTLGARNNALYYSGRMFQHVVFNKELTQAEVDEIYNLGIVIDPLDHSASNFEVAYNPLGDDDVFNIVSDKKNSNDGLMTNMTVDDFVEDIP